MSTFVEGAVITRQAAKHLRRYQYHGADKSLIYKYILSPLAEGCLVFVPSWMAPNVVTTIGLALTSVSYLLMYLTAPGMLSYDTPGWVYPTAALGLFLYQTMDNMDGKQARRTGSASPLGLIFDHGCDAINCCFGVVFVACILNAGSNLRLLSAIFLNQVIPFFFTTWEHYYTDELILPIVNGPSEGVILGVICACLRGYYGPDFFLDPRAELKGWTLGQALMAFSLCGVVVTMLKQFIMVVLVRRKVKRGMIAPLFDLCGFTLLLTYAGGWAWCRPELFMAMPYTMVVLLGFLHVDAAVHLMVCHVCNMKCRPIRPILVPFMMVVASSFLPWGHRHVAKEANVVWGFTVVVLLYEFFYLYMVVQETSEALDIFVFKLGKRSKATAERNGGTNGESSKTK